MGKQDKDAISYSSFCMNFALILIFWKTLNISFKSSILLNVE